MSHLISRLKPLKSTSFIDNLFISVGLLLDDEHEDIDMEIVEEDIFSGGHYGTF